MDCEEADEISIKKDLDKIKINEYRKKISKRYYEKIPPIYIANAIMREEINSNRTFVNRTIKYFETYFLGQSEDWLRLKKDLTSKWILIFAGFTTVAFLIKGYCLTSLNKAYSLFSWLPEWINPIFSDLIALDRVPIWQLLFFIYSIISIFCWFNFYSHYTKLKRVNKSEMESIRRGEIRILELSEAWRIIIQVFWSFRNLVRYCYVWSIFLIKLLVSCFGFEISWAVWPNL